MRAVFGLGNPGNKYKNTRHNIGFVITDYMSEYYNVPFKAGKGDYYFTEFSYHNERVLLVKPTTYMNRSGLALQHALKFFPISVEDIITVYDDFHLNFGTIRFRSQGSDGGHNGLSSIIYQLQTENFDRLRFGIGDEFSDAIRHVLSVFTEQERAHLTKLIEVCKKGIENWIEHGIDATMNQFNGTYIEHNTNQ